MKIFEYTINSITSENYRHKQSITSLCMVPEKVDEDPGIMLFVHGWGGNRFQNQPMMEYVCDKYNLVCISPEYRQSGHAFDAQKGIGYSKPYDASFQQVFDSLNVLRFYIDIFGNIYRNRIYNMGQSQGGQIVLLCSIFAPNTFAFTNPYCPMTHLDEPKIALTGRDFSERELNVRNAVLNADKILCPVYVVHGTADENVDCQSHTGALVKVLNENNKGVYVKYYEGGGHGLLPVITRLDAFKEMLEKDILSLERECNDDFAAKNVIDIDCGNSTLRIDWAKAAKNEPYVKWLSD